MFRTIKTLVAGSSARTEERVRDIYSIELIDQKIREAEGGLKSAKYGLANRRIIDLKQGAIAAKAVRREQGIQKHLTRHVAGDCAIDEAEGLIARIMQQDDPFKQGEILRHIDRGLQNEDVADRMAEAGFGPSSKTTANDVLNRLRT